MLPHAAETWDGLGWQYPMASMLATAAFLLMLLIEHVFLPEHSHRGLHEPTGHSFDALVGESREGIGAYVVLAALSVHSLLAGLALGAEASLASALVLFFAIFAHKSTAGFALGVSLVRSRVARGRSWLLLGLFAVSTPVGILVGTGLEAFLEGPAERTVEASFLSLAAGTFVYVATFDILRDEFLEPGGRFAKWTLVTAGAAVMGGVAFFL
jgi:zinc transporter 1/2/3